ncbi:MAG: LLM class flavin-dependent oxidoreductase [Deltaproteobacteria bacterium]|nr:LLM class flavin-dependent oxidoreductase [Deltaproteobacteria bacterium]
MFTLRFDMRAPDEGPASPVDLYRCALEMAEWGESHGAISALVSEHHSSPDGYLPSPLILASAIVGRTKTLPINAGAVLLNLYDPIKLAEDMVILDIVSEGRVSYTIGLGYRAAEYAMFGVEMSERAATMEGKLGGLLRAVRGERFDYEGRPVHVTPAPYTEGGPVIFYGGQSRAAAKRAGRFGLGFMAGGGDPSLADDYAEAARSAGHDPGACVIPADGMHTTVFLARDVDEGWRRYGPYMLHDANMYGAWMGPNDKSASKSLAKTVDELRAEDGPYQIYTPEVAVESIGRGISLGLQPLSGGCPPELAWESLALLGSDVLPRL